MHFLSKFQWLVKEAAYRSGRCRSLFRAYPYMFTPRQLMFLTECLSETKTIPGSCVEVGCFAGATTAYLCNYMKDEAIHKTYYAIDTFAGFVPTHVNHEVSQRLKPMRIASKFSMNDKRWFDYSIELADIQNVHSIRADATKFDFTPLGPIAFCLVDVDLYVPVLHVLKHLHDQVSPGGIIVVDDCKVDVEWDGALQAYQEFCVYHKKQEEIRLGKLGVIRL